MRHSNAAAELLDESREKCRQLEDEADKRVSEAQDGWALAAQLQQYFRNLNNLLVNAQSDADIAVDDGDDDEEPSQLAVKINGRIASLRKDYNSCQSVNKNNNETIEQLTGEDLFSDFSLCYFIVIAVCGIV